VKGHQKNRKEETVGRSRVEVGKRKRYRLRIGIGKEYEVGIRKRRE
jgi:hypothetical protein